MRATAKQHVLAIKPFRRLWTAMSFNSLGDWLNLLAVIAMAALLSGGDFAAKNFAVAGVLAIKLLPALVLSPLGAAIADRLDRRTTMLAADAVRVALVLTIPLVGSLQWLFIAFLLIECVGLIWRPARDATVPELVPADQVEQARQYGLLTTYAMAPLAAVAFAAVYLVSAWLAPAAPYLADNPGALAFYVNSAAYLVSALLTLGLTGISGRHQASAQLPIKQFFIGRRSVRTRLVRGLAVGLVGVFIATGAVVGVAESYVTDGLHGGQPGFGLVFGAVCLGVALGMFFGPRLLLRMSRRRLFGLTAIVAGIAVDLIALISNLPIVVMLTVVLGLLAGTAWIVGCGLIEREEEEERHVGAFAYLQSLLRVALLFAVPLAPVLAGIGGSYIFRLGADVSYRFAGTNAVLLVAGLVSVVAGFLALRRMDDRPSVPLTAELIAAMRGEPYSVEPDAPHRTLGLFIAFEGGEGSGKTTQSRLLSIWLRDQGYDVVQTREPGATQIGMRLRAILLDMTSKGMSPYAEALLYAADRAEHADAVIRPGIERGAIVVSDRYADSSLAYQGAGRKLDRAKVAEINEWATGGLKPDLTVLIDVPAEVGFSRFASAPADRIESEPREFHERVRREFRELAAADPDRYLVIDGTRPMNEISKQIQVHVHDILPDPVPDNSEDATHTFQAIRE